MQAVTRGINDAANKNRLIIMGKIPFILKKLSIQKMPGFPMGLSEYKELSPNINIVFGPNGSGKSSTARIIPKLIWRNLTDGIQVESSVDLDHKPLEIKIDSGKVIVQSNGVKADVLGLPAEEESGRYMLALHELVKEDDKALAQQIVKESIGGYDLELAQRNLGYADNVRNRGTLEFTKYETANNSVRDIEQKQKDLKKEEEKLEELFICKAKAEEATRLTDLYEKVVQWLESKINFDQLIIQYHTFPSLLNNINGDELIAIEGLEKDLEAADNGIALAQNEIVQNRKRLSELNLPEAGVKDITLNELKDRVKDLVVTELEIRNTETKISGLQIKQRETIGSDLNPTGWENIQLEDVNGLDEFLLEAHQTLSEKHFLEVETRELKSELEENMGPETKLLNEGISALTKWLQEQGTATSTFKIPVWWLFVLSVTGVLAALSAYFVGLAGFLAGISIVVVEVLIMVFYSGKKVTAVNTDIRKQDYDSTGLPQPETWETNGVRGRIETLMEDFNKAKWQNKIQQKIAIRVNGLEALQGQLQRIELKRQELHDKIKGLPQILTERLKNEDSLYWFLIHVKNWKVYYIEIEGLRAQKEKLLNDFSNSRVIINQLLNESNADSITDGISANAIYQKLIEDDRKQREASAEINRQEITKQEKENQKANARKKLCDIYNRINIEFDNKEEVRKLIEQLDEYKRVEQSYQVTEGILANKSEQMKVHSLFELNKAEIESLTLDQAIDKRNKLLEKAGELTEINKDITTLETTIQHVMSGHALEDALSVRDEKLNDLEQLYENNLSSITGKLIIDQLKEQTRDKNRPEVFKRAKVLFSKITRGRYRLILDDGAPVSFKAYDTISNLGQNLSELSTGTRIQLLISVRLAFIETQEPLIQLPILADELLANSDDTRAIAIIEALVEISREGRQIFYFTAQTDEVNKWENYLKINNDISYKIFELTGGANETVKYAERRVDPSSFNLIHIIPYPEKLSHEEYGQKIEVPYFDILTEKPEKLHLWYLLEDNLLLRNCLEIGIEYWGQLKNYLEQDGKIEGLTDLTMSLARNKIQLLRHLIELYRKGRSLPIDQKVLVASRVVTSTFIDAVLRKLKELKGNPKSLIKALRNKEVAGFQKSKIEDLQNYLCEEGFINEEPVVKIEDMLTRIKAYCSNMDIDIVDAEFFIKEVLKYPEQLTEKLTIATDLEVFN